MRSLVLALVFAAAPAAARAELQLVPEPFGPPRHAPPALDLPILRLDGGTPLLLDEGGGAGSRRRSVEPVVALVLGIIPGFGIGHLISGSPRFPLWLVVDVAILAFWYFGVWGEPYYLDSTPLRGLFGLLILAERIVEGVDAFQQAGGHFSQLGLPPDDVRVALNMARPERDPALAPVLARF